MSVLCYRYPGFAESEEAAPIAGLLQAYEEGDQEAADQILHSPLFRYMENDVSVHTACSHTGGSTCQTACYVLALLIVLCYFVKFSSTGGGAGFSLSLPVLLMTR